MEERSWTYMGMGYHVGGVNSAARSGGEAERFIVGNCDCGG